MAACIYKGDAGPLGEIQPHGRTSTSGSCGGEIGSYDACPKVDRRIAFPPRRARPSDEHRNSGQGPIELSEVYGVRRADGHKCIGK